MRLQQSRSKTYGEVIKAWVKFGDRSYYLKSKWEINYAHYLQYMKQKGDISDWFYEEDEFWFLNIMRGVRSYKPDFKVIFPNGQVEYHEVKGYMDPKSRTKIKRLNKYYPHILLVVIDKEKYYSVARWHSLIPNWIR